MGKKKKSFYAVFSGHKPGIYEEWFGEDGAKAQIDGFSKAKYKKFETKEEALEWMEALENPDKAAASSEKPKPASEKKPAAEKKKSKKKASSKGPGEIKKPANPDKLPEVVMYTDGACSGNPGPGGYGTVLFYKDKKRELSGGFRRTTNNRMEMTACIEGLKALKKPCAVTLFSDSSYVVNAMEKGWAKRWKAKGWQRTPEQKAVNADLWQQMLELCEKHRVAFNWVKGHAGNEHNELCDRLAVEAASESELPRDEGYEQAEKEKKEKKKKAKEKGKKSGKEKETETQASAAHDLECPECGAPMELREGKYGKFYGCTRFPDCKGAHGAHPDGRPLGTPADSETKQWRMKAHDAFDALWKSGDMERNEAYDWLCEQMELDREDCHIGKFDKRQCESVVEICERLCDS